MPRRSYFVYIMANRSATLYIGVTNNLGRRLREHRKGREGTFTGRYRMTRLVYYEIFSDVRLAIAREKQIKGWLRRRKIAMINAANPTWQDLAPEPDPSLRSG